MVEKRKIAICGMVFAYDKLGAARCQQIEKFGVPRSRGLPPACHRAADDSRKAEPWGMRSQAEPGNE